VGNSIEMHTSTTTAVRGALLAVATAVLFNKHAVDDTIDSLWSRLRGSPTFAHDSFEPVLSTLAFAPPLVFFYVLDRLSTSNRGAWLKAYR
jgi:hypothetical protein